MNTRFILKSDPADFAMVPAVLETTLPAGVLDRAAEARLRLALHELLVNISRHAYGHANGAIEILVHPVEDAVQLTVTDSGLPFGGKISSRPPVHPSTGGYGLSIISGAADDVEYSRSGRVNRWRLVFESRAGSRS